VLGIDPRHERRRCSKGPGSSCKRRRSSSS
jgi:hypothetical protein